MKSPIFFLSTRYKFGFVLGACSLALAAALLATSRPVSMNAVIRETVEESLVRISSGTFSSGLTLYDVLSRAAVPPPRIMEITGVLKKQLNPRTLKGSDAYEIGQTAENILERLIITRGLTQYVLNRSSANTFDISKQPIPLQTIEKSVAGRLGNSLWESMRSRGINPELIMGFADMFAWNLDFLTEPRNGDRFALLWERETTPSGDIARRRILAALYEGRMAGRHLAFLHDGDFYNEKGESVRKAFLKAPLNFRRISSGFSNRRFHPILRRFTPHWGIDYAAPSGTPVVSVGDGVVTYKGWKPAYGRYMQVRHNNTYTTCYAHFSRYTQNLRVGSRIKQGQVIGYVGATGHATGPHLDFRVIKNGRFVNFLKLDFPSDKKISSAERPTFLSKAARWTALLEEELRTAGTPIS